MRSLNSTLLLFWELILKNVTNGGFTSHGWNFWSERGTPQPRMTSWIGTHSFVMQVPQIQFPLINQSLLIGALPFRINKYWSRESKREINKQGLSWDVEDLGSRPYSEWRVGCWSWAFYIPTEGTNHCITDCSGVSFSFWEVPIFVSVQNENKLQSFNICHEMAFLFSGCLARILSGQSSFPCRFLEARWTFRMIKCKKIKGLLLFRDANTPRPLLLIKFLLQKM